MAHHKYIDKYVANSGKTVYVYDDPRKTGNERRAEQAAYNQRLKNAGKVQARRDEAAKIQADVAAGNKRAARDTSGYSRDWLRREGNKHYAREAKLKRDKFEYNLDVGNRAKSNTMIGEFNDLNRYFRKGDDPTMGGDIGPLYLNSAKNFADEHAQQKKQRKANITRLRQLNDDYKHDQWDKANAQKKNAPKKHEQVVQSIKSAGSRTLSSLKSMASGVRNLFGW